jgi:hypothetical protein
MSDKIYTHLVRSLDLAGLLRITPHESYAAAVKEQAHRREECQHHQVVVMPVVTETIPLPSGAAINVYFAAAAPGTRKPEPVTGHRAQTAVNHV